jgi:hypothetical protein
MGEKCIKISVEKPEGRRPTEKSRRRWKDNIKMYLKEIGWEDVDRIHLVQSKDQWWAPVNTVMNLQFSQNIGNFSIN